jgi:hypothetical protein
MALSSSIFGGIASGATAGTAVLPGIGTAVGATVGALADLFGGSGRSAAQVSADEANSIASNEGGFLQAYGIKLTDQQVQNILAPGWAAGENGTQLWARMVAAYNTALAQSQTASGTTQNNSSGINSSNIGLPNKTVIPNQNTSSTTTQTILGIPSTYFLIGLVILVVYFLTKGKV